MHGEETDPSDLRENLIKNTPAHRLELVLSQCAVPTEKSTASKVIARTLCVSGGTSFVRGAYRGLPALVGVFSDPGEAWLREKGIKQTIICAAAGSLLSSVANGFLTYRAIENILEHFRRQTLFKKESCDVGEVIWKGVWVAFGVAAGTVLSLYNDFEDNWSVVLFGMGFIPNVLQCTVGSLALGKELKEISRSFVAARCSKDQARLLYSRKVMVDSLDFLIDALKKEAYAGVNFDSLDSFSAGTYRSAFNETSPKTLSVCQEFWNLFIAKSRWLVMLAALWMTIYSCEAYTRESLTDVERLLGGESPTTELVGYTFLAPFLSLVQGWTMETLYTLWQFLSRIGLMGAAFNFSHPMLTMGALIFGTLLFLSPTSNTAFSMLHNHPEPSSLAKLFGPLADELNVDIATIIGTMIFNSTGTFSYIASRYEEKVLSGIEEQNPSQRALIESLMKLRFWVTEAPKEDMTPDNFAILLAMLGDLADKIGKKDELGSLLEKSCEGYSRKSSVGMP